MLWCCRLGQLFIILGLGNRRGSQPVKGIPTAVCLAHYDSMVMRNAVIVKRGCSLKVRGHITVTPFLAHGDSMLVVWNSVIFQCFAVGWASGKAVNRMLSTPLIYYHFEWQFFRLIRVSRMPLDSLSLVITIWSIFTERCLYWQVPPTLFWHPMCLISIVFNVQHSQIYSC